MNFKCDPIVIGSLLSDEGVFSAYHMNKEPWAAMALDGSASDETIKLARDISYDITAPKPKKNERGKL